jgi:hypothetical protein
VGFCPEVTDGNPVVAKDNWSLRLFGEVIGVGNFSDNLPEPGGIMLKSAGLVEGSYDQGCRLFFVV